MGGRRGRASGSARRSELARPSRPRAPSPSAATGRPPRVGLGQRAEETDARRRASARQRPGRSSARSARSSPRPGAAPGTRARSRSRPSTTSCSGIGRSIPPRRSSRSCRSRPTSRSSCSELGGRAVVERALDAGVVELLAAADERAADVDLDALARPRPRPSSRGAPVASRPAGGCRRPRRARRVEARVPVGRVERLAARVRLDVHRAAGGDERGDVGDRVEDAVAAVAALEVERLVEIHRLGRVDRDERDVRLFGVRQPWRGGRLPGVGAHLLRKAELDVQVVAELRERRLDLWGVGGREADAALHAEEPRGSAVLADVASRRPTSKDRSVVAPVAPRSRGKESGWTPT